MRLAPRQLTAALDSFGAPTVPITQPWELSIASIVGRHVTVPKVVGKGLGALDRVGALRITPTEVGLDGETVAWDAVAEVITLPAWRLLSTVVLEREAERIRALLPPVPGRKWLVGEATEWGSALIDRALAHASADEGRELVATIVRRRRFGRRTGIRPGAVAASMLAVLPEANRSIVATAQERGIPVRSGVAPS